MTQPRREIASRAPALSSLTGFLLRRAYARTLDFARTSLDDDANMRDVGVLTILDSHGPMSQGAVADRMQTNRTVMVKLAEALESEGYLVRDRNPADRRAYALTITDAGRLRLKELLRELTDAEVILTAHLSAPDHARLNELLRTLVPEDALATFPTLRDHTGYLVSVAHLQLRGDAIDLLKPLGIEPRDFGVMSVIDRDGPCTQQHVADVLGVSAPTVLWAIDDLERNGLVRRARVTSDRRSYDLSLTESGRWCLSDAVELVETVQARMTERLGERGDVELRTLLTSIVGL
ncbi:MarR family winged helix-turn-helix transcriptional regulator [Solicola gregarius]|uniref:MarR family transcriptional regulator n=1 Tax=Solicola gregarius TaxID=2908642 RepID=A0AA46TGG8_9ACTN|nr:MarR family transcriptional regulator [Solicola gregarius]UYM04399.1 MarR family transcriptional regulator [Solicola gregarius]